MTKVNDIFGRGDRPVATGAIKHAGAGNDPFGPAVRSIFGIVRESAGLVRHVAELGVVLVLVLVLDTNASASKPQAPTKPRPAPEACNVIRFRTGKTVKTRARQAKEDEDRDEID